MGFPIANYTRLRPYAFHLTARANLPVLKHSRQLDTAAAILAQASRPDLLKERRTEATTVPVNGRDVLLRDQSPLHSGNICFDDGWTLETLVEELNHRVFFWPGTAKGPSDYGRRHFERYKDERPIVLRICTVDLLSHNPELQPQFCPFNSGAPRTTGGKKSPRGRKLFLPADRFERRASAVVELTFRGSVTLPHSTEWADSYSSTWQPL
jgi:hypothetical protein